MSPASTRSRGNAGKERARDSQEEMMKPCRLWRVLSFLGERGIREEMGPMLSLGLPRFRRKDTPSCIVHRARSSEAGALDRGGQP